MRLNQASDFALRILMLLADQKEPLTVDVIATRLDMAKSHTMKIVAKLVKAEVLLSLRGRTGGVLLGKPKQDIIIGDVVRIVEADFAIVECMQPGNQACMFLPNCKLKGLMYQARSAFLNVLDEQNLEMITSRS
ncbi:MAG: Rrf2 family transcriptional regulator [Lentilitoribacter sp.]